MLNRESTHARQDDGKQKINESESEKIVTVAEFKQYIEQNFQHHQNIKRAIAILQCLEYIKDNIDHIAKEAEKHARTKHLGPKGVMRDINKMAIHVDVYQTAEQAQFGFRHLIAYVESALTKLIAEPKESTPISNPQTQQRVINLFIEKIDDSDIGCMEARLLPAVRFLESFLNSPNIELNVLMNEFFMKHTNSVTISDVFSYFQEQVAIPLLVMTKESNVAVPLTWALIKDYCENIIGFDEKEWDSYHTPFIVAAFPSEFHKKDTRYYLHFRDKEFADQHLANLKTTFYSDPTNETLALELESASIKQINLNQFYPYHYKLTPTQYHAYLETLKRKTTPVSLKGKEKEKDDEQEASDLLRQQKQDLFSSDYCELSITHHKEYNPKSLTNTKYRWYLLYFAKKEQAEECLGQTKAFINEIYPGVNQAIVSYAPESNPDKPFHFTLKYDQFDRLRKQRRAFEDTLSIHRNFAIKAIRADKENFIYDFLEGLPSLSERAENLARPKQPPLRTAQKLAYVVKGNGVTCRIADEYTKLQGIPVKTPQYEPEQKAGFSKAQSVSLGTPFSCPPLFSFSNTQNKIGFYFSEENILLSDYNDIPYIGRTVHRPNNFKSAKDAKKYAKRIGQTLFPANIVQIEYAINSPENVGKSNESLARLGWNSDGTCSLIIGSELLSARALAQEYAKLVKKRYRLSDAHPIKIYFYDPKQNYHLHEYSKQEQATDRAIAMAIFNNEESRRFEYQASRYEYLLLLPERQIKGYLLEAVSNYGNRFFSMLYSDNVTVARLLLDKIKNNADFVQDISKLDIPDDLKTRAAYNCLHRNAYDLAEFTLSSIQKNANLAKPVDATDLASTLLYMAIKKGRHDWVKRLLENEEIVKFCVKKTNYTSVINPFAFLIKNFHLNPEAYTKMFHLLQKVHPTLPPGVFASIAQGGHLDLLILFSAHYERDDSDVLHHAVENGHTHILEWLLYLSINAYLHVTPDLYTLACNSGQSAALDLLITWAKSQTPDALPRFKTNEMVSYTSDVVHVIFKYFICNDKTLFNLLYNAMQRKNDELVEYLLTIPNIANKAHELHAKEKLTPIHIAVANHNVNLLSKLLAASPHVQMVFPNENGNTPLHDAVLSSDIVVAQLLLQHQASSINMKDKKGSTPLHLAVLDRNVKMIESLLETPNIDINIRNKEGLTAFEVAARKSILHKKPEMIRAFIASKNIRENIVINFKDFSSVHAMRKLMQSDISFSKVMQRFLRNEVRKYNAKRDNESKYHKTKLTGMLFHSLKLNHSKQEKCDAAEFLLAHDDNWRTYELQPDFNKHKSALSKGRLGAIFSLILANKDSDTNRMLLKQDEGKVEIIVDESASHKHSI